MLRSGIKIWVFNRFRDIVKRFRQRCGSRTSIGRSCAQVASGAWPRDHGQTVPSRQYPRTGNVCRSSLATLLIGSTGVGRQFEVISGQTPIAAALSLIVTDPVTDPVPKVQLRSVIRSGAAKVTLPTLEAHGNAARFERQLAQAAALERTRTGSGHQQAGLAGDPAPHWWGSRGGRDFVRRCFFGERVRCDPGRCDPEKLEPGERPATEELLFSPRR
jgi:hypothetical protein